MRASMEKSFASVPALLQVTDPIAPVTVGADEVQSTFSGVDASASPSMIGSDASTVSVTTMRIVRDVWLASESVALAVTR